jgi:predicted TIM-barrel fold metal-dependent hydrolase
MAAPVSTRRALLCGAGAGAAMALGSAGDTFAQSARDDRWGFGVRPEQTLPRSAVNGPWRNMRAVRERKVFDIHVHSYETPRQGSNYAESGAQHARDEWHDYTSELIASMDRHGVAKAALNPAFTSYEEIYQTSYLPHRDRFVLSVGWPTAAIRERTRGGSTGQFVMPVTPQEVAQIFERQLSVDGAKFVGETAGYSLLRGTLGQLPLRELHPIIDVILAHDVPVQIHTGWSPTGRSMESAAGAAYETASDWAEATGRFMAAFPQVKVILAHLGGQFGRVDGDEALRLLYSFDNAYGDTAKATVDVVTAAVRGVGPERVLFGSDWNRPELKEYGPYHMRSAYQHWHNLNTIAEADLTEDQRDWVLYKSAERLLRLGGGA